jgi:hypothetical protein
MHFDLSYFSLPHFPPETMVGRPAGKGEKGTVGGGGAPAAAKVKISEGTNDKRSGSPHPSTLLKLRQFRT